MHFWSFAQNALPSKLSRVFAGASIALSAAAFTGYEYVPLPWLPSAETERFLLRLLIAETVLLIGALATLVSVVHYLNSGPDLKGAIEDARRRVSHDGTR